MKKIVSLLTIALLSTSLFSQIVTLSVDVSNQSLSPDETVHWNSDQNGWCGGCAPMTDMGGGIWEIAIDAAAEGYAAGDWLYQFLIINSVTGAETPETLNSAEDAACTLTDGAFTNRVITVGATDVTLGTVCWESCTATCSAGTGNVLTLKVDVSNETLGIDDKVYWNSNQNGWCGTCAEMFDTGNGIWELVVDQNIPDGNWEYVFLIGTPEVNYAEAMNPIEDAACTVSAFGFTNRAVTMSGSAQDMGTVCWESCEATCGSSDLGCMDASATNYDPAATIDDGSCQYDITFLVDMNDVIPAFTTPEVNATFNGWCGGCAPMTDPDMDGVWEITINLPEGDHEFKFAADSWNIQEGLVEGAPCTITTDGYTNRTLNVSGNETYGPVAWNLCASCPEDITGDGQININDFLSFNSSFGTSCSCPEDINGDGNVDINDFLALNSVFGQDCD